MVIKRSLYILPSIQYRSFYVQSLLDIYWSIYVLLCPFYIRCSLKYIASYVLLWGHLTYNYYCGVLLLYFMYAVSFALSWDTSVLCTLIVGLTPVHKMVPYIYSVICTIMGPSHVHLLLWSFTPVHA